MGFSQEKVPEFLEMFEQIQTKISAFNGCHGVKLYRDHDLSNVFYTHSKWTNIDALNAYRNSDFFQSTWKKTKAMFEEKPLAYSLIEP